MSKTGSHGESGDRGAEGALLREILHIGIVVDDLEGAIAAWERLFGVRAGERWESEVR